MRKTAVVVDAEYLKHAPGDFHPERPERIQVLLDFAADSINSGFSSCHQGGNESGNRGVPWVRLYFARESTSQKNRYALDGDTITCRDSFGVGLLAVGGCCGFWIPLPHASRKTDLR